MFLHRKAEMHGGHVRRRGRRELGTDRVHIQSLHERVVAMPRQELESKRIEQEQDDPLVTIVQAPGDLARDLRKRIRRGRRWLGQSRLAYPAAHLAQAASVAL
jgi:hypothetical protein